MVRKQIYLKQRQIQVLQKRAKLPGVSESELIRRAIDHELRGEITHFYPDPEAKEELRRFLLTFQPAQLNGPPYRYDREEIYEERLDLTRGNPD